MNETGTEERDFVVFEDDNGEEFELDVIDYFSYDKIVMFDLFPKDEKENLTQAEKSALKQVVKAIGEEFKK